MLKNSWAESEKDNPHQGIVEPLYSEKTKMNVKLLVLHQCAAQVIIYLQLHFVRSSVVIWH